MSGLRSQRRKILAISSGGGHWVQLCRLREALEGHEVIFATVHEQYRGDVPPDAGFYKIRDATRWDRFGLVVLVFQILRILVAVRPDVIVSTGAAPGYFALRFGKWLGARTVWIDSVANVDGMSMAGLKVKDYADLWLTQWEHLAYPGGPTYRGAVM